MSNPEFSAYDVFQIAEDEVIPEGLPTRIRLVDSGRFLPVNLDNMELDGDAGVRRINLKQIKGYSNATSEIISYVFLHALNGRRKTSTAIRWINEFSLFSRMVVQHVDRPISTVTLPMYQWHAAQKSPSQQKLLRSFLKYWADLRVPGLSADLKHYLVCSKSPKARSKIEIQNTTEKERPFSIPQIRSLLANISTLLIGGSFLPQDYLLWRLIVSEAMRPSQLRLLQVGDVSFKHAQSGQIKEAYLNVPIVKQQGTPARRYMLSYRVSKAVARALHEHLVFLRNLNTEELPNSLPLFSIGKAGNRLTIISNRIPSIENQIHRTRGLIAALSSELEDSDLFTRRFKHTKLTHLAMLGAPLQVLARAGFQTSTVSLSHYVNLTSEAFSEYEVAMADHHDEILSAFKGTVIERSCVTNPSRKYSILDTRLDKDVGSCAGDPCNARQPLACYTCQRFQAFADGSHQVVMDELLRKRESRINMGLGTDEIARDDHLIQAVANVLTTISERAQNGG